MCSHTNHQITDRASKQYQYPKNSRALEPLSWGHFDATQFLLTTSKSHYRHRRLA